MNATNLTIRVDAGLKNEAEALFEELGMSISTAFNVFLRQAVRLQAIPFAITKGANNQLTIRALREAERIAADPTVPAFTDRASLLQSLEA